MTGPLHKRRTGAPTPEGGVGAVRIRLFRPLLLLVVALAPALAHAAATLKGMDFAALPGERVRILLTLDQDATEPSSFSTENPARIALDLKDTANGLPQRTKDINVGVVRNVTAVEAGGRTRVVINLASMVPHRTEVQGNTVAITLDSIGTTAALKDARRQGPATADKPAATSRVIRDVNFRRGPGGEGRVEVRLGDPNIVVDVEERGTKVLVDFIGAGVPERLVRRLDVTDFATPVLEVDTLPQGGNAHMEVQTQGLYEYLSYQADDAFILEFRPLTKQEKEKLAKERFTYTGQRLSLNFQDIEVRAVLQLLADFTDLNFVTSDTVGGNLTLRLRNVPWDQALDIILKTKGLDKRQVGNVILVAPTEEIAAREKIELESQKQIEELAPLRSEFIQVNYATAADIAALLKTKDNSLLSERGSVTIDQRTNTLLVQDTAAKLENIRELVTRLDVPVRQVLIESRIVIANDDFAEDLGVRFGFSGYGVRSGLNYGVGGGITGDLNPLLDVGASEGGIVNPIFSTGASGNENLLVDLPATGPSGAINLLVGRVGEHLLRLELSAMQTEGRGEVISSPRVITSDKSEAVIKQGQEIPYLSQTSSGATDVEFKDAVLQLKVTPQITPDDRIIMDLSLNKDEADFARSVNGTPPLNTRQLDTTVLVDNGDTIILGGVYEQTKSQSQEQVPFFGDLPLIGNLFKQRAHQDRKQELLIFITPKILKDTLQLN
ncbi:MAG: type IV pilus secretin PilQ [Chromatiales bacterium]|nr:type IV pilus secretin PilQ [Chromatiales bacterium]